MRGSSSSGPTVQLAPKMSTPRLCSTGGNTEHSFTPPAGDSYFLVVPRNAFREGSYGTDSFGPERPPGVSTCLVQFISDCE